MGSRPHLSSTDCSRNSYAVKVALQGVPPEVNPKPPILFSGQVSSG